MSDESKTAPVLDDSDCCGAADAGPYAHYLPNLVVHTHENKRAIFYRDLIQGKIVLINLMSIKNDDVYPVTANLAKVQLLLGDRLGRDIFMYSITVDPENDSPEALSEFAKHHGAGPGWLFLTGARDQIETLAARVFGSHGAAGGHSQHHHISAEGLASAHDCSLGIVRYGNEAKGLWASVPAKADPPWIAERIAWVSPRNKPTLVRRAGPAPLAAQHPVTARIINR